MTEEWSSFCAKMTDGQASPPPESPTSSQAGSPVPSAQNAPRYGTIIPNRIFVGGIAFNTSDAELKNFFSAFGHVKESKIIADRAGVSKGYGFITFETPEEAHRILKDHANTLVFKEKKLNIGQAIRKQPLKYPKDVDPALIPSGMVFHSPSGGYSYTYHNGVAYFNPSDVPTATHSHPTPTSIAHHPQPPQPQYAAPYTVPIMLPPPAPHHQHYVTNQQPQYTYQQPQAVRQTVPQYQWRFVHTQAPPAAVNSSMISQMYPTPPQTHAHELMYPQAHHYQPQELAEVPIMEPSPAEGATVVDHAMPAQVLTRQPYMGAADLQQAYAAATNPYDPNASIPSALLAQKVAPKFAGKRPIKMPRRGDRAVKTIRTDLPPNPAAPPCTSPMAMAGYAGMMMAAPQRVDETMIVNYNGTPHMGGTAHMGGAPHMGNAAHVTGAGDN